MTVSTNIHLLRPVFTVQGYTGLKVKNIPSRFLPATNWKKVIANTMFSFSRWRRCYKFPRAFPRVSCLGSAKAVERPRPGLKIGDKSKKIPRYSPVCPRMSPYVNPPGMAADRCITTIHYFNFFFLVLNLLNFVLWVKVVAGLVFCLTGCLPMFSFSWLTKVSG